MSAGIEEATGSPEAEVQAGVSHLTWVLGTELRSPAITVAALNHCSVSPGPSK